MTLLSTLPKHLFGAVSIALMCLVPAVHSAELEGTIVPFDAVESTSSIATDVSAAPDEPTAPIVEQAPAPAATPAAPQWQGHSSWERDWGQNLSNAFSDHNEDSGFDPALLIPLFVIGFIFGGPIVLLILLLVFLFSARRRRQQDINMNIDKLLAAGRDIPVELLRGDEPKGADDTGNQAKGIRNICLGAGWLVFLTIAFGISFGAIGFIWIGLGVSQVLIWYLNKPSVIDQAGPQD